jgi:hypothetical protein
MQAYTRPLQMARRADGALPSGTMMTTTCSADGSVVGPILKLHAAPVGRHKADKSSLLLFVRFRRGKADKVQAGRFVCL